MSPTFHSLRHRNYRLFWSADGTTFDYDGDGERMLAQIRALKRTLSRSFMDVGLILVDIRDKRLYEAKGYGSFEAFLEREIELGKTASLRLARAVELFQRPAAIAGGMDKVLAAVAAFDGDAADNQTAPPTSSGGLRSPIPFHKR